MRFLFLLTAACIVALILAMEQGVREESSAESIMKLENISRMST